MQGKICIITGASRGIGAATARYLAQNGAKLVLAARSGDQLQTLTASLKDEGADVISQICDVTNYQDVAAIASLARDHFGSIDLLVNNAGLIEPITPLADSDPDEWCQVADVNYKGTYFGIRAVLPIMLTQKAGGTIINISSGAATSVLEGWSHYCSSKAAALALTRSTDLEYRSRDIRVIGLSPGTVATDMQVAIRQSGINPVSQLDPACHIPAEWVGKAVAGLFGPIGNNFLGEDFRLGAIENRAILGLPLS